MSIKNAEELKNKLNEKAEEVVEQAAEQAMENMPEPPKDENGNPIAPPDGGHGGRPPFNKEEKLKEE